MDRRHQFGTIEQRIRNARRRLTGYASASGLLVLAASFVAAWLIVAALESQFWFSPTTRLILIALVSTLFIVLLTFGVVLPVLRHSGILPGASDEDVARLVGQQFPDVEDKLLSYVQLKRGRHSSASLPFVSSAAEMLDRDLSIVESFEQIGDRKRVKSSFIWFVVALLPFVVAFTTTGDPLLAASNRLITPLVEYSRPALFTAIADPGNTTVVKGADVQIDFVATGKRVPDQGTISIQNEGESLIQEISVLGDSGRFSQTIESVKRSFQYRFSALGEDLEWYQVTVVEHPFVKSLQLVVTPPAYSGLTSQRLAPNVGDVTALPGSRVDMEVGVGGTNVAEASVLFEKAGAVDLNMESAKGETTFFVKRDQMYSIALTSDRGVTNKDPVTYRISQTADLDPTIEIISPELEADLTEDLSAPVLARIVDDYGFSRLDLHYRKSKSRFEESDNQFSSVQIPIAEQGVVEQNIEFVWQLGEVIEPRPIPGEEVEMYLRVYDNDTVNGPKFAQSRTLTFRFPSLAERYRSLDEKKDDALESLQEAIEESEALEDEFRELRQDIQQNPESSLDKQRQLEQLQQKQQQLESQVEEVADAIQDAIEQMEENDLASEEMIDMFKELQKVVDEINSPELMETLEDLQQAMNEMNMKDIQEALDDFEFDENQFQERLGRTMELFKNIRVQQELEEIAELANALEQTEKELEEKTGELEDSNEADKSQQAENLAEQQEQAKQDMAALEEQLKKTAEHMEELKSGPKSEMNELMESVESAQLQDQMQQNAEQLRQEDLQNAQQGQQQMQQQLQKMEESAMQMQAGMQSSQLQINMAGLRQALNDALLLSHSQEGLRDDVAGLTSGGPQLREFARQQVEIASALGSVADSLRVLSQNIPQMTRQLQTHSNEALREMGAATKAMTDRVSQRAISHQSGALTEINELAVLLADLLNQLQNNSSGGGGQSLSEMIQQLQQMSQNQQSLNDEIQQMLNSMSGQRMTPDMEARLQQIASQQDAMRRQLREMNRNSEARGKMLGDLNKIAQQMEESIREMQRRQLGRRTVYRQQQILSRLLQATRSIEERGKQKERESTVGEDSERVSPNGTLPSERENQLRRELIRALESGYSADYEELIKKYFDLLQRRGSD